MAQNGNIDISQILQGADSFVQTANKITEASDKIVNAVNDINNATSKSNQKSIRLKAEYKDVEKASSIIEELYSKTKTPATITIKTKDDAGNDKIEKIINPDHISNVYNLSGYFSSYDTALNSLKNKWNDFVNYLNDHPALTIDDMLDSKQSLSTDVLRYANAFSALGGDISSVSEDIATFVEKMRLLPSMSELNGFSYTERNFKAAFEYFKQLQEQGLAEFDNYSTLDGVKVALLELSDAAKRAAESTSESSSAGSRAAEESANKAEESVEREKKAYETIEEIRAKAYKNYKKLNIEDDEDFNNHTLSYSEEIDYDESKKNRLSHLQDVLKEIQDTKERIEETIKVSESVYDFYTEQENSEYEIDRYSKDLERQYEKLQRYDELIEYINKQISESALNFKPGDNWGTEEINVLITLLQELAKNISVISNSINGFDKSSDFQTIIQQFNDMGTEISAIIFKLGDLQKAISGINFNVMFNTASSKSITAKATEESMASIEALNKYKVAYEELLNVLMPNGNSLDILKGQNSLFKRFFDASELAGQESRSSQLAGYKEMISVLKEAANIKNIDLSQWETSFENVAIESNTAFEKIISGEKEVQDTSDMFKNLFGGGVANIENLSSSLDELLSKIDQIYKLLTKVFSVNPLENADVENSFKSYFDVVNKLYSLFETVGVNNVKSGENLISTGEESSLSNLKAMINDVTTAVENKTNAFRQEGEVVGGVVQEEITMLTALSGWISIILDDIRALIDGLSNIPNIDSKMKDFSNDGDFIDKNLSQAINNIKGLFEDFNSESIENLSQSISTTFSSLNIENISKFSEVLEKLISNLNSFNNVGLANSAFDSINQLLSHTDELKNLAQILTESDKKIKAVAGSISKKKDTIEASDFLKRKDSDIKKAVESYFSGDLISLELEAEADGVVKATAIINEALDDGSASFKKYTLNVKETSDEISVSTAKTLEGGLSLKKQAKAYQDFIEKIKQSGKTLGQDSEVFTPKSEGWEELINLAKEFGVEIENVNKITRKVRDGGYESFTFTDLLGNSKTLGYSSHSILMQTDQIVDAEKTMKDYYNTIGMVESVYKKLGNDAHAPGQVEKLTNHLLELLDTIALLHDKKLISDEDFEHATRYAVEMNQNIQKIQSQKKSQEDEKNNQKQKAASNVSTVTDERKNITETAKAVNEYVSALNTLIAVEKELAKNPLDESLKASKESAEAAKKSAETRLDEAEKNSKRTELQNARILKQQAKLTAVQSTQYKLETENIFTPDNIKNGQDLVNMYQKLGKAAVTYYSLLDRQNSGETLTKNEQTILENLKAQFSRANDFENILKIVEQFGNDAVEATKKAQDAFKTTTQGAEDYIKGSRGDIYSSRVKSLTARSGMTTEFTTELDNVKNKIIELNSLDISVDADDKRVIELRNEIEKLLADLESNPKFVIAVETNIQKAQTDISTWISNNSAAMSRFGPEIKAIQSGLDNLRFGKGTQADVDNLVNQFNKLKQAAADAGAVGASFGDTVRARMKSLGAYLMTFVGFNDVVRYVREAFNTVKELDTALVDLRKTAHMSSDELQQFYYGANDAAKEYGITTQQLIQQAADWSRLGYNTNETATNMAKLSAQFAAISPDMTTDDATTGLVSIMKAYDIDVNNVLDGIESKVNAVGNAFATSNGQIITGLQKSSSALAAANNSFEQSVALFTAGQEILQNDQIMGQSLKTISMRIRGYDEETEEISEDLTNISGVVADLTKTASTPGGISLFTDNTKQTYRTTYDILKDIAGIWDQLTDANQAKLLEKLFGKTRAQAGAAILTNFEQAEKALKVMKESAGGADAEMDIIRDSLQYKINALQQTWVGFVQNIGDRKSIGSIIDGLTAISSSITSLVDLVGPLSSFSGLLIGIAASYAKIGMFKFNPETRGISFQYNPKNFKFNGEDIKSNLENEFKNLNINLSGSLNLEDVQEIKSLDFKHWFNTLGEEAQQGFTTVNGAIDGYIEHLKEASESQGIFSNAMITISNLAKTALATGLNIAVSMLATSIISFAIQSIDKFVHRSENLIKKGKEAKEVIDEIYSDFDKQQEAVDDDRFFELREKTNANAETNQNKSLNNEEYKEYISLSNQMASLFPELITGYDAQGNAILNLSNASGEAKEQLEELLEQERQIAAFKISEQLQTAFAGVQEQSRVLNEDLNSVNANISTLENARDTIDLQELNLDESTFTLSYDNTGLSSDSLKAISASVKAFNEAAKQSGIEMLKNEATTNSWTGILNLEDATSEQIEQFKEVYSNELENAAKGLSVDLKDLYLLKNNDLREIEANWQSIIPSMISSMSVYKEYNEFSDNIKSAINSAIGDLSIKDMLDENGDAPENIRQFLANRFLDPINSVLDSLTSTEQEKASEAFEKLFSLDKNVNVKQYSEQFKEAIGGVHDYFVKAGLNEVDFSNFLITFGFRTEDGDLGTTYIDSLKDSIKDAAAERDQVINEDLLDEITVTQLITLEADVQKDSTGNIDTMIQEIVDKNNEAPPSIEFGAIVKLDDNTTTIDTLQTDLSSLSETISKFRSGSLETSDITDLIQQFPQLATETQKLDQTLSGIQYDKLSQGIGQLRESFSGITDPVQLAAVERFIQILQNMSGITTAPDNWESLILSKVPEVTTSGRQRPEVRQNILSLANKYGDTTEGRAAMLRVFADPSNFLKDFNELESLVNDTIAYVKLDISEDSIKNFDDKLERLSRESQLLQSKNDYKVALGLDLNKNDYENLINNAAQQIETEYEKIAEYAGEIERLKEEQQDNPNIDNTDSIKALEREIISCESNIVSARKSTIEWNDSIKQLPIDQIEENRNNISRQRDALQRNRDIKSLHGIDVTSEDYQGDLSLIEQDIVELENERGRYLLNGLSNAFRRAWESGNESDFKLSDAEKADINQKSDEIVQAQSEKAKVRIDAYTADKDIIDEEIDEIDNRLSKINDNNDYKISLGIELDETDYNSQISLLQKRLEKVTEAKATAEEAQKLENPGSENWMSLNQDIIECEESSRHLRQEILELQDALRNLPIERIERNRAEISSSRGDLERSRNSRTRKGEYLTADDFSQDNELIRKDTQQLNEQLVTNYLQSARNSLVRTLATGDISELTKFSKEDIETIDATKGAIDSNAQELADNYKSTIDSTIEPFNDAIDLINTEIDLKSKELDTVKTQGASDETIADYYKELTDSLSSKKSLYENIINSAQDMLNNPEAYDIEINPATFESLNTIISSAKGELLGLTQTQIEYNNALRNLPIEKIEAAQNLNASRRNKIEARQTLRQTQGEYLTEKDYLEINDSIEDDIESLQNLLDITNNKIRNNRQTNKEYMGSVEHMNDVSQAAEYAAQIIEKQNEQYEQQYQARRAAYNIPQLQDENTDLQSQQAYYENQISLLEAKNEKVSTDYYKDLVSNGKDQIKNLKTQKSALKALQSEYKGNATKVRELQSEIDSVDSSISSMESSIAGWQDSVNNLIVSNAQALSSAISTALSEMNSETGLAYETMQDLSKQFGDLENHDISALFYRTAEGVKVDTDRLKEYAQQENDIIANDFANRIKEINDAMRNETPGSPAMQEYQKQLETILDEQARYYAEYQRQIAQLSKFNAIDIAESTENQGAHYDKSHERLKTYKEASDNGLTGTDEFQAYTAYLDEWGRTTDEAFTKVYTKASRYLTEDATDGLDALLTDMQTLGLAAQDATGTWTLHFEDSEEAAHKLGIGVELLTDSLGKMEEYGFDIINVRDLTDASLKAQDMSQELYEAKKTLHEMENGGASAEAIADQQAVVDNIIENQKTLSTLTNEYITKTEQQRKDQFKGLEEEFSWLQDQYKEALKNNDDETAKKWLDDAQTLFDQYGLKLEITPEGIEWDSSSYERYKKAMENIGTWETPLSAQQVGFSEEDIFNNKQDVGAWMNVTSKLQAAHAENNAIVEDSLATLKKYTAEQLKSINLSDGQYDNTFKGAKEAEQALDTLASTLGLSAHDAQFLAEALQGVGQTADAAEINISTFDSLDSQITRGTDALRKMHREGEFELDIDANPAEMSITELQEKIDTLKRNIQSNPNLNHEQILAMQNLQQSYEATLNVKTFIQEVNDGGGNITLDELLAMDGEEANAYINAHVDGEDATKLIEDLNEIRENGTSDVKMTVTIDESQFETLTQQNIDKTVTVNSEQVDSATEKVNTLNETALSEKTQSVNTGEIDNAKRKLTSLNGMKLNDKSVTVTAYTGAAQTALNNIATSITKIRDKTVTITVNRVTHGSGGTIGETPQFTGTLLSPAKASGTAYNVKNYIPLNSAKANGDVAVDRDQESLVNELGTESIIRNGQWFLIPGGMRTFDLKKGDIVLNHLQTKSLIEEGKAPGRGKLYSTAWATGTMYNGMPANATAGKGSLKKKKGSSTSSKTSTSSGGKGGNSGGKGKGNNNTGSLDNFKKWLEKLFDWIEVRLDRVQYRIDLNAAKMENAVGYLSKNSFVEDSIKIIGNRANADKLSYSNVVGDDGVVHKIATKYTGNNTGLIADNARGAVRYQQQANKVYNQAVKNGLVSKEKGKDLIKLIQTGAIDVSEYDDKTKEFINDYKEWYDKSQQAIANIEDLKTQLNDLYQQELDNIVDDFESMANYAEAVKSASEATVDLYTAQGRTVNSNEAKTQIRSQMAQQSNITKTISNEIDVYRKKLAEAGTAWGTNSVRYREAEAKLQEMNQALSESQTAYLELNKQLQQLDITKLEYVIDRFEALGNKLSSLLSLNEKRGTTIKESDYTTQVDNNNRLIGYYYDEMNKYINMIQSNNWELDSDQYKEAYDNIVNCEDAIIKLLDANEDLKQSIRSLRWKAFNDLQEKTTQTIDDLDYLRGLMTESQWFTEDNKFTERGYANIALLGQAILDTKKQVNDYKVALEKLEKEYKNGNITLDQYKEDTKQYLDAIKSGVTNIQEYKNALVEMYKTQITKENEALQDLITKRKEALSAKKEYYDYDKTLSERNRDIQNLKAQIAALEGVDNQAAKAELTRLKASLGEAQDELQDTVRNHVYELHQNEYDTLSNDLQTALDDTIESIESNAQKHEEVVQSMLDRLKLNWEEAALGINDIVTTSGLEISNAGEVSVSAISNVVSEIGRMQEGTAAMVEQFKAAMAEIQASAQATAINVSQIKIQTQTTQAAENAVRGNTTKQNSSTLGATGTSAANGATSKAAAAGTTTATTAAKTTTSTPATKTSTTQTKATYNLTLSKGSVSIQVGKSAAVTATYSSTDKNAKPSVTSANAKVATASISGKTITIKGVKAGNTKVTVKYGTTTKAITVTVKAASSSSGGDGKAKVGDRVTFASGSYHNDSYGGGPSGSQHRGGKVYITKIAPGRAYPYHISTGKKLHNGDLGWVKLKQLKGYASGTKRVPASGDYWTQEDNPEMIIRKSDGAVLTKLNAGDSVIPSNLTDNLFKWGRMNPEAVFGSTTTNNKTITNVAKVAGADVHFDSLITVNGNVDREVMGSLNDLASTLINDRNFMNNVTNYVSRSTARDARKIGLKG